MTSLTAIFGHSRTRESVSTGDSDKLLDLYWNRAELKKEFATLREEKYRLQERVREEQGGAARIQQKLEHLENLLADPEWVHNVVVHYQLRALERRCRRKLAAFAEELKQQREHKQHRQLLSDWQEQSALELKAIQREINSRRGRLQGLEDRLDVERRRLASMSRFMKLLYRRSAMAVIDSLAVEIEASLQEEKGLLEDLESLRHSRPPDAQGLTVATKRLINFMILAYAQHLYLHFRKGGLAGLMKDAVDKSVGAVNYGSKTDCDHILEGIRQRRDGLETAPEFATALRQRARMIGEAALFRSENDAVPKAATVSRIYRIDASGNVETDNDADLLGENYWQLAEVVSR